VSPELRVLAIAGSLRRDSFNRRLLHAAAELAPPGMGIDVFDAITAIPLFNEDFESPAPPAVDELRSAVASADALLIATPEYNQSLPGVVKNLVDWLSRGQPSVLDGKSMAILGATAGQWGTRLAQSALRHSLAACEAFVMPAPQLYVHRAAELFDGPRLVDARTRDALANFLVSFRRWIRRDW